jgi:electron transfer flavoprotein alpha subunit
MVAIVVVRHGTLPSGGAEAMAEAGGRCVVIGEGAESAAKILPAGEVTAVEAVGYEPARWAAALLPLVDGSHGVVLPASPDGRDLAPHLAKACGRPLYAGAISVTDRRVQVARWGGLAIEDIHPDQPFVATLQPGVRGADHHHDEPDVTAAALDMPSGVAGGVTIVDVLPPDVATMDLAEAPRLLGGGAGLDSADRFAQLQRIATALDASMGATRVITDRAWVRHERQIGTTGVVVSPRLYLSFGISGAVQHTAGLGDPEHIISVNIDPACPMMAMSDVAIVADANAVLDELEARLTARPSDG